MDWILQYATDKQFQELMKQGVGYRVIARALGITNYKAHTLQRHYKKVGVAATENAPPPTVAETKVTKLQENPSYQFEYRATTEEYVFTFPGKSGPLILPADTVRQMKIDYTNWDGNSHTLEQVAMANNITTNEFYGIKTAMGWRKTSLPLLDEDMADMDEDEITEKLFAYKKRGAEIKAKRRIWKEIEDKAQKYDQIVNGDLRIIEKAIENLLDNYTPSPPLKNVVKDTQPWALVFSPTDLHYGKYHWAQYGGGPKFDRERCRARLMQATNNMFSRLKGRPEVIISCIGSDWFNADNVQGKTTSATHTQDMDGTPEQMWEEGMALAIDIHETIRTQTKEMWIVLQRGNHDDMLSGALFSVLKAWFRNDPNIKFHDGRGPYNYVQYGNSMFGITHGHGEHRADKIANIMAKERPNIWGATKYKYALTGNLHHFAVHEQGGVLCFLLPSLTGADRYHTRQGFMMARPGLMGLCFDKQSGFMSSVFGHVSDDLIPAPADEFGGG